MTTRDLVNLLLDCDMNAEISLDLDTYGPISRDAEVEIKKVEISDQGIEKYTIIRIGEEQS